MRPRYVRLPLLDDAACAELGERVLWELSCENAGLHWAAYLQPRSVIADALFRLDTIKWRSK